MLEKLPSVVGQFLHNQRAGLDSIAYNRVDVRNGQAQIAVTSLAFVDHGPIPALYTEDGDGMSPPLAWDGIPPNATSLVLIVEDADSPTPSPLVHAIAVDIPVAQTSLRQGALNGEEVGDDAVTIGRNSYLQTGWLAPDPPPGHGVHRYAFQVFALVDSIDDQPDFSGTPGRDDVIEAIRERAIASGCLIGTYERADPTEKIGEDDRAAKDEVEVPSLIPTGSGPLPT